MKDWSIAHLERLKDQGTIRDYLVTTPPGNTIAEMIRRIKAGDKSITPRPSKYGATRTTVEGITFDSAKEAGRFTRLRMLERAGLIKDLRRQVPYDLNPGGTHSLVYQADFVYFDLTIGATIVEDAKGYQTREYRKKKKLMAKVHGIKIFET